MYKNIVDFWRHEIGYFVTYVIGTTQPFQIVGTYAENVTETPNASYINDDWFKYITTVSTNPRFIIDGDDLTTASDSISIVDDYIQNNFSHRYLFTETIEAISRFTFEPLTTATPSACMLWRRIVRGKIRAMFEANREKYARLYEAFTAEYDPLTDLTEKITVTHSGTDSRANSGTDTRTHSGTDTTTHGGKDTTQNSGTDTTTHGGTDSKTHTGTETTAESGTDGTANTVYAFDSSNAVNKDATTNTYGKTDTTTYNTGESMTHGETIGTAHGKKTELTHGETVTTQHGQSVATLHGKTETTTHGEKVVTEKEAGNREPALLIREHVELWENASFLDSVAYDIVKRISTT